MLTRRTMRFNQRLSSHNNLSQFVPHWKIFFEMEALKRTQPIRDRDRERGSPKCVGKSKICRSLKSPIKLIPFFYSRMTTRVGPHDVKTAYPQNGWPAAVFEKCASRSPKKKAQEMTPQQTHRRAAAQRSVSLIQFNGDDWIIFKPCLRCSLSGRLT